MNEQPTDLPLDEFVRLLPKTETHLHLEGALPIELLRTVRSDVDLSSWESEFKFSGFELSVASGALEQADLNGREVLAAITAAAPPELEVRVFLGIHHDGNTPRMAPTLVECIDWPELSGLDLHGSEGVPLEPWTAPLWRAARQHGKLTKAHAGEFSGPDFVWRVLTELEPDRIEHGVRAVEDPRLVKELIRRGVALDMCPISNHRLLPGVRLDNHPIRELFDAGVTITLSTDDPVMFGNTVSDEYVALAERRGFRVASSRAPIS